LLALLISVPAKTVAVGMGRPWLDWWDLLAVVFCYLISKMLWYKSALHQWMAGSASGLCVLYKMERAELFPGGDIKTTQFAVQRGDSMNTVSPRAVMHATFRLRQGTCKLHKVTILNTHLNALGPGEHRKTQLQEVLEIAELRMSSEHFLIICGDFNAGPDSEEFLKYLGGILPGFSRDGFFK
jgi:hypothetical protein